MKKILKLIDLKQQNKIALLFLLSLGTFIIFPEYALASGGVDEFATPLEKVIDILQGPMGLAISIISFIICFVSYMMKGSEIGETFKGMVNIVIPISGSCGAGSLVAFLFQFSGAVI